MSAKQPERRWTLEEIVNAYEAIPAIYWGDPHAFIDELKALPEPSLPPETGKRDLPLERGNVEFGESLFFDESLFYELMQSYRHAPVDRQRAVTEAYEAVLGFIADLLPETGNGEFDLEAACKYGAKRGWKNADPNSDDIYMYNDCFIAGAKWQFERMKK